MNDSDINQQELEEQISKTLEGMSNDEIREVFIESLILERFGDDEEIDEDVFKDLKEDLNDRLDTKINDMLVEALPEEKMAEFDGLVAENASSDAVRAMLFENGVDVDKLVTDAMREFREEYLAGATNNEGE